MENYRTDILLLQETHINTNSKERTLHGHLLVNSTNISDVVRATAEAKRAARPKRQSKGPGKGKESGKGPVKYGDQEHHGVGCLINKAIIGAIKDINQISGNLLHITLRAPFHDIHIVNCYAPHGGKDRDIKVKFWNELEKLLDSIPDCEPTLIAGDLNVRCVNVGGSPRIGPFIFPNSGDSEHEGTKYNRERAIELMNKETSSWPTHSLKKDVRTGHL